MVGLLCGRRRIIYWESDPFRELRKSPGHSFQDVLNVIYWESDPFRELRKIYLVLAKIAVLSIGNLTRLGN